MGTLTDAEQTDARRFAGYPVFGDTPSGFVGYRFFVAYGNLEYKLQHLLPAEEAVLREYLANLKTLDAAIPTVSENLDTDKAAVWVHNPNELRDRINLYNYYRRQLCIFLGVPAGPDLAAAGGIRIVV